MVFGDSQNRGLPSLYAMIRFCINNKTCRRVMMSQYFGEALTVHDCNKHCDFCSNPKTLEQRDVTAHAQTVLQILGHIGLSGNKATMIQLTEMMRGGGKQKTLGLHFQAIKDLTKDECEKLLNWMLMEDILQEDFHWTPYNTISYLVQGEKASAVRNNRMKVIMDFEETEKKKKRERKTTKKSKENEEEDDGSDHEKERKRKRTHNKTRKEKQNDEGEKGEAEEDYYDFDFGDDFVGGSVNDSSKNNGSEKKTEQEKENTKERGREWEGEGEGEEGGNTDEEDFVPVKKQRTRKLL